MYIKLGQKFSENYLSGFGNGSLFLIRREDLLPVCSVYIGADFTAIEENIQDLTYGDELMISLVCEELGCHSTSRAMAYDNINQQIVLDTEALNFLNNTLN